MRQRRILAATAVALAAAVSGWAALTIPTADASTAGRASQRTVAQVEAAKADAAKAAAKVSAAQAKAAKKAKAAQAKAAKAKAAKAGTFAGPADSPVAKNGQLSVCGVNLCNEAGTAIQLRGMSGGGLQFFPDCINPSSLAALRNDWKADFIRISMYVQEGGFETDPAGFTAKVNEAVETATALGLYAIIDFHILNPGDPNFNLARAKSFFADVAATHAAKTNVLYEIANEPNKVSWDGIRSYAEQVIPIIRKSSPKSVVLVGTRGFSSLGFSEGGNETEVINDPVKAANVMYTFHFYAASHKDAQRAVLARAAKSLPMFVSEFGTQTFTGDDANDLDSTDIWLDLLKSLKISYAMWSFSDGEQTSSAFVKGACAGTSFAGDAVLTESGRYIQSRISTGVGKHPENP